jgi:methionyl-tRNA formyltransferase
MMRILFIGCVESSYFLLKKLLSCNKSVCGVVTQKENAYNSDFKDIAPLCDEYDVDIYYTKNINDEETRKFIKSLNPDIIYCFGWSQLIGSEIIKSVKNGIVGFHPAALPYNKGRHPIIWALVLGLNQTASSFFMMNEKADNGSIISQKKISISVDDDASSLYDKILECAGEQVIEFTEKFENHTIEYIIQPDGIGNIWRKRTKDDGKIDFRMSAKNIYNLVRGLTKPYVGAHFIYNGNEYKVWKCKIVEDELNTYQNIEFGKVLKVESKHSFLIKTGDQLLKIIECDDIDLVGGEYL